MPDSRTDHSTPQPSAPSSVHDAQFAHRALWALFSVFASLGVLIGLWAASVPVLQKKMGLQENTLGLSILCFGMGAVVASFMAPRWIHRYTTRRLMWVGGALMWLAFASLLWSPTLPMFVCSLLLMGLGCGAMDTAMNSHAFTIEYHLGKPAISLFHGGYSLGNVLGSGLAAAVIALGLPFYASLTALAPIAIIRLWLAHHRCYSHDSQHDDAPADENTTQPATSRRIPLALWMIALMTALAFFAEGAVGDWSGIYVRDYKQANPTQTAMGLGAFAVGMMLARFNGDRLRARFALLPLLIASSAWATLMMAVFVYAPNATVALMALGLAGIGYANVVPLLFARAAHIDGVPTAKGIAFTAGMGYANLLAGPALVGFIAHASSLQIALWLAIIGSAFIAIEATWQYRNSVTK